MPSSSSRYHQLALLWLQDRAKFARYLELVAPIVGRYGAGLECQFHPTSIHAEGMECPDLVNLVYYESRAAYEAFTRDPDFRRIVHLRSESIALASVEGSSEAGVAALDPSEQRVYLIELARLSADGPQGYRTYESEAEPVMQRYGYAVERVLHPDTSSGLPFTPDLVKIASFATAAQLERMHEDPAHSRIENVLYPAGVAASVWLVGSAHR